MHNLTAAREARNGGERTEGGGSARQPEGPRKLGTINNCVLLFKAHHAHHRQSHTQPHTPTPKPPDATRRIRNVNHGSGTRLTRPRLQKKYIYKKKKYEKIRGLLVGKYSVEVMKSNRAEP